MSKRFWKVISPGLSIVFLLTLLLSACSSGGSNPTPTPAATTAPPAVPGTPTASTSPDAAVTSNPTAATTAQAAPKGPRAEAGLNVYLYDQTDDQIQQVVDWLQELGVKWVRHQLSWYKTEPSKGQYDWAQLDRVVESLTRAKVKIILNPVHSPSWACECAPGLPDDPQDFADFMSEVTKRYKGKVAAYEIWNEPNLDREAGTPVDALRYFKVLRATYTSIKAVDPTATVLLGALTPTGVQDPNHAIDDTRFLKQLYTINKGEIKKYFDVLGAHPGGNNNPPDTMWPQQPGPGGGPANCRPTCWQRNASFYFRRIEQLRQIMVDSGDAAKQMWITEFGWPSATNPAEGFAYAAENTEDLQAQYIARAFEKGRDDYNWVGVMTLFQLNYALPSITANADDEIVAWGIIRRDGSKRPSFYAVQKYAKGN